MENEEKKYSLIIQMKPFFLGYGEELKKLFDTFDKISEQGEIRQGDIANIRSALSNVITDVNRLLAWVEATDALEMSRVYFKIYWSNIGRIQTPIHGSKQEEAND